MKDSVVEEVRQIREQIAKECGYDLDRIIEHARVTASKIPGLEYITLEEMKALRANSKAAREEYERQPRY